MVLGSLHHNFEAIASLYATSRPKIYHSSRRKWMVTLPWIMDIVTSFLVIY